MENMFWFPRSKVFFPRRAQDTAAPPGDPEARASLCFGQETPFVESIAVSPSVQKLNECFSTLQVCGFLVVSL